MHVVVIVLVGVAVTVVNGVFWGFIHPRTNQWALNRRASGKGGFMTKPLTPGPVHDAEKAAKERSA
jgi:hypothetical protein